MIEFDYMTSVLYLLIQTLATLNNSLNYLPTNYTYVAIMINQTVTSSITAFHHHRFKRPCFRACTGWTVSPIKKVNWGYLAQFFIYSRMPLPTRRQPL
jgi:hypothetical protein